jgi:CoA:oxalate CoA-transferase
MVGDESRVPGDLPDDVQMVANDYIVNHEHPVWGRIRIPGSPVTLGATPANPRGHAPEHGEHTEQILTGLLGYSWEEVGALRDRQVI